ncbi:MAG TPA: Hpt domain-containing protein, partial [Spirochaetia bacterium]|nr:Hpt domain-containing protein [Spirochaetia bacterium]
MFGVAGPEDARLSRAFLEESEELVQKLGQSLVTLEDSSDSALVNEVFRLTHSLKSESALMGYASLSRLSHAMEDVLGMVRSGTLSLSKDVRDLLLAGADRSAAMISEIARDGKESESGAADIIRDLSTLVAPDRGSLSAEPGGPAEAGGEPVFDALELRRIREARDRGESLVRLSVTVVHDEPMKFARAFLVFSNLEQVVNVIRVAPTMDGEPVDDSRYEKTIFYITAPPGDDVIQSAARVDQISSVLVERIGFPDKAALKDSATGLERGDAAFTARPRTAEKTSIRVDTRKLDELWSFVAELVLQKAHIARLSDAVGKGMDAALIREELVESSDSLEKLSNGMQEAMRDARMIPISILFGKLPRLVRDLSRKLEKPAELVLAGEDTEIDRSLIEALSDPLTHIIRNCLDHGLEFPEERVRLGKPEKGRVTASARRQGGTIIIELADDGRGLDTERIRRKAIGMGVPGAATMEEARLQELVFLPGFSTKEVVTDLSGRGVGMDVVATRVRKDLKGDVSLAT